MTISILACVRWSETSLSGRCVVASATRSQRPRSSWPSNIIAVRSVPASWESNSVWPTKAWPARTIASLFTGAVTSASSSSTQTALRAFAHPGDRRARRGGRAFQQVGRQGVRQRVAEEDPPGLVLAGVVLQGKLQPELLVEAARVLRVADQEVTRVVGLRLERQAP